jgi:hypothetical protein
MSPYWVAVVGGVSAAAALAWPYIPKLRAPSLSPSDRAGWVTRLFSLAASADEAGEAQVASSARALIAALVHQPDVSKKGK